MTQVDHPPPIISVHNVSLVRGVVSLGGGGGGPLIPALGHSVMCYIMDKLRVNIVTCVFSLPPLSTLSPSSFIYRSSYSSFVSFILLLLLSLLALLWRSFPLPLRLFMLLLLLLFPLLPLLPLSLFILFLIILGCRLFLLLRELRLLLLLPHLVFCLFLPDFLLFTLPCLSLLLLSCFLFLFLSLPPGALISLFFRWSLLCFPLLFFSFLFRSFRLLFFSHASSSLVYTSIPAHVLIISDQYLSLVRWYHSVAG